MQFLMHTFLIIPQLQMLLTCGCGWTETIPGCLFGRYVVVLFSGVSQCCFCIPVTLRPCCVLTPLLSSSLLQPMTHRQSHGQIKAYKVTFWSPEENEQHSETVSPSSFAAPVNLSHFAALRGDRIVASVVAENNKGASPSSRVIIPLNWTGTFWEVGRERQFFSFQVYFFTLLTSNGTTGELEWFSQVLHYSLSAWLFVFPDKESVAASRAVYADGSFLLLWQSNENATCGYVVEWHEGSCRVNCPVEWIKVAPGSSNASIESGRLEMIPCLDKSDQSGQENLSLCSIFPLKLCFQFLFKKKTNIQKNPLP